jgi:hypothetical protein
MSRYRRVVDPFRVRAGDFGRPRAGRVRNRDVVAAGDDDPGAVVV